MTGGIGLRRVVAPFVLVSMAVTVLAQEPVVEVSPAEGVWRTLLESEVTIAACEEGFCGTLSRIVVPDGMLSGAEAEAAAEMAPEEFFDYRNEDPALRDRPMLGLQILTLWPGDEPFIFDGEIYNPEDGKTYEGYVEMVGEDALRLNGCVLFNVVCRGEDWVRVPAEELAARLEAEATEEAAPAQ